MPDGFDPHVELQTIWNLREMMLECRKDTQAVIEMYRFHLARLKENEDATIQEVVLLGETILSRGHGKPRQSVGVTIDSSNDPQVKFYIPHNGREADETKTIDME